jgi:predicted transcriptional regulator YdeE
MSQSKEKTMQKPRFESREAFRVIGMHVRSTPFSDDFPKLWDAFIPRMDEIIGRSEKHASYGVEWDSDKESDQFSYLAGFAVVADAPIPEGMMEVHIPAQEYAIFDFELKDIQATMMYIYKKWLPTSEYRTSGGPEFELYDERFNPKKGKDEMSMYVPVIKK